MSMKSEYLWLKKVIGSPDNKIEHRPALLNLVKIYESRWIGNSQVKQSLAKTSAMSLRKMIKSQ